MNRTQEGPPTHIKGEGAAEKIAAAAIKRGDEIFTGRTHIDAITKMEERYPKWFDSEVPVNDGFITDAGRFVERDEAGRIASEAGQLAHLKSGGRRRGAKAHLDANDMRN